MLNPSEIDRKIVRVVMDVMYLDVGKFEEI